MTHARGSKHAGDGNQFMGVVELPIGSLESTKKNKEYVNESDNRGRTSRTGREISI